MWGASDDPPSLSDTMNPTDQLDFAGRSSEKCEKEDQLSTYKELMLKHQFELKKKEEEVQEYAEKLTKIQSKVKLSRRTMDPTSLDSSQSHENELNIDETTEAKTPKGRTHLLQKKLAENRLIFEQRNRELNESQRAVEEKVLAIKQQINESDVSLEKERKYLELNDKILELQAVIIDLQDNLKEKDNVIDAKTRAITLMSENLSKKNKTTLDTLDETKEEMKIMQEKFSDVESSFKIKITHLLKQLEEKEEKIDELTNESNQKNQPDLENQQIDELKKQIDENNKLNSTIDTLNVELDKFKRINQSLYEKIKSIKDLPENFDLNMENMDFEGMENILESSDKAEIAKLKRELDESNKNMIKLKAQHKSKQRSLQKRIETLQTMPEGKSELVNLENQVALLEEEKVKNEELQKKLDEFENKNIEQIREIQAHIDAIAQLENQKLDLIQELHASKQEFSRLENENSESENLRVTAELKIVELEEQLENLQQLRKENDFNTTVLEKESEEQTDSLLHQFPEFQEEKFELHQQLEDSSKKSSPVGSTESFERIMEVPDNSTDTIASLNEKIANLTEENYDLVIKMTKLQERQLIETKQPDSEIITTLNEKITNLTKENNDLLEEIQKLQEKQLLHSTLQAQNDQFILENEKLREKIHQMDQNEQHLQSNITELTKLNEEFQETTKKTLETQISTLELKIIQLEGSITDQHWIEDTLESLLSKKEQTIDHLEDEKRQNHQNISILQAENKKLSNLLEKNEVAFNSQHEQHSNAIHRLEEHLQNRNQLINDLNQEIAKLKDLIDENEKIKNESLVEQLNNNAKMSQIHAENVELHNKISFHEVDLKNLTDNKIIMDKELEELRKTTNKLIEEMKKSSLNIEKLEKDQIYNRNHCSEQIDILSNTTHELTFELDEKNREIVQMVENMEIIKKSSLEKIESNQQLKNQIDELNLIIKSNENFFQHFETEIQILDNKIIHINQELTKLYSNTTENDLKIDSIDSSHTEEQLNYPEKLLQRSKTLHSNLQTLENVVIQLLNEKEDLNQKFTTEMADKLNYQAEIVNLERKIENLSRILQENEVKIQEIHEINEKLEKSLQEEVLRNNENKLIIDDLNNRYYNLQTTAEDLQREISDSQTVKTNQNATITALTEEKSNLEQNLELERQKSREIQALIEELQQEKQEMEHKLSEEMSNNKLSASTIDELRSELQNRSENLENIKSELSRAYQQIEGLNIKYIQEFNTLNSRSEVLMADLTAKTQEIEDLRSVINEKDAQIGKNITEGHIMAKDERITQLESELETANNNTNSQIHKMKVIAANLKKKTSQCHDLERELHDIQQQQHENHLKQVELTEKLENTIEELSKKNFQVQELEEKIQNIENNNRKIMTNINSHVMSLEVNLNKYSDEFESLKLARDAIETEFNAFKDENSEIMDKKNLELEEVTEQARELGVRMEVMETEYLKQSNTIQQLKTENALLLSKQAQLNERLENAQIEINEYQQNLEKTGREIVENATIIEDLIKTRLELSEELKLMREKILQSEKTNENLEKQISNLQIDSKTEVLPSETIDSPQEILFDASRCFDTGFNDNSKVESEVVRLKSALEDRENLGKRLETENMELQQQLERLQAELSVLSIKSENKSGEIVELPLDNASTEVTIAEDDENWAWNTQEAEMASASDFVPFISPENIQLQAKIGELEDKIRDIEAEKLKLETDLTNLQAKNTKIVKKLRAFKIQNDALQQQLKLQISSGDLCNLDYTIEEELRNQVIDLEKQLMELKTENNKLINERNNYLKRIDILVAANDRLTEVKERQDRDLEILSIRNEEYAKKLKLLAPKTPEESTNPIKTELSDEIPQKTVQGECLNCKEKINELQQDIDRLETQNEELQRSIEIERLENIENKRETEDCKKEAEETKVSFFDMLETSHNLQKVCLDDLNSTNQQQNLFVQDQERLLNDADSKIQQLQAELNTNFAQIQDLNENLIENERNLQIKNIKLQEMELEFTNTQLKLQEMIEEKEKTVQNLEEKLQQTSTTLQIKITELEKYQHDFEELKIEFNNEISKNERQLMELHNTPIKSEILESENEENRIIIQKLQSDILEINERLLEAVNDRDRWQELYQNCDFKLSELNDSMSNVTELLNVRVQEVADLKQYVQKLEFDKRDLEACHSTVESLNQRLADKNQENLMITQEYSDKTVRKELEIDSLNKIINNLNMQLDENASELKSRCKELKFLKETINQSEILISTIKTELAINSQNIHDKMNDSRDEIKQVVTIVNQLQQIMLSTHAESDESVNPIILKERDTQTIIEKLNADYEKIIVELKRELREKDEEIEDLKYILNESTYPGIIKELQDKINILYDEKAKMEAALLPNFDNSIDVPKVSGEPSSSENDTIKSNELDVALYMLHQRDVRCEELTHELMQLLEERDTLQLRLSNAIRLNEELRRSTVGSSSKDDQDSSLTVNQEVQTSQPQTSQDEKQLLTQKLSQLHNIGHRRDVRLMDERELRHNQQMSLIANKDALSTLPPDAAARLINANYTLSRDVQSQSSVLMNWLWGKSTPKIVHT